MGGFTTGTGEVHGLETVHLGADGDHGLHASFAPSANLILYSLTLGGRELLAQRNGVQAYVDRGSTMGVTLLHPWANRLEGDAYAAAGTEVRFAPDSPLIKRDPSGL